LNQNDIPVLVISAVFRKDQVFFKWYGGFMRNALKMVAHFFVQDRKSEELISQLGFDNVTLSGDTRFDRVSQQIQMDNRVDFISAFVRDRLCIVIGSSWAEDEAVFIDFVNTASDQVCFIIAPHEIKDAKISQLKKNIKKETVLYTEKEDKDLGSFNVFIMDTIGYLSRVYSYGGVVWDPQDFIIFWNRPHLGFLLL